MYPFSNAVSLIVKRGIVTDMYCGGNSRFLAGLSYADSPAKDSPQWIAAGLYASFFFRRYQRASRTSQAISTTARTASAVWVVRNHPGV